MIRSNIRPVPDLLMCTVHNMCSQHGHRLREERIIRKQSNKCQSWWYRCANGPPGTGPVKAQPAEASPGTALQATRPCPSRLVPGKRPMPSRAGPKSTACGAGWASPRPESQRSGRGHMRERAPQQVPNPTGPLAVAPRCVTGALSSSSHFAVRSACAAARRRGLVMKRQNLSAAQSWYWYRAARHHAPSHVLAARHGHMRVAEAGGQ